jgi:GGDEF domain-containing protein
VRARPIRLGPGLGARSVTVSGGVAFLPANGRDAETLMRAADEALYHAKDAGRDTIRRA